MTEFGVRTPPVIDNRDGYDEFINGCAEAALPGLCVKTIGLRKNAHVEFDFILTQGWVIVEKGDGITWKMGATLSERAVEACQRIADGYNDDVQGPYSRVFISGGYTCTPKLPFDVAKTLADQLSPIVNDRSNWILQKRLYGLEKVGGRFRMPYTEGGSEEHGSKFTHEGVECTVAYNVSEDGTPLCYSGFVQLPEKIRGEGVECIEPIADLHGVELQSPDENGWVRFDCERPGDICAHINGEPFPGHIDRAAKSRTIRVWTYDRVHEEVKKLAEEIAVVAGISSADGHFGSVGNVDFLDALEFDGDGFDEEFYDAEASRRDWERPDADVMEVMRALFGGLGGNFGERGVDRPEE